MRPEFGETPHAQIPPVAGKMSVTACSRQLLRSAECGPVEMFKFRIE